MFIKVTTDRMRWVKRRHRLLRNEGDTASEQFAVRPPRQRQQILALKLHGSRGDTESARELIGDHPADHGLARTRLADQPKDAPARQLERHVAQDGRRPGLHRKPAGGEQRRRACLPGLDSCRGFVDHAISRRDATRGSSVMRNPSPNMLAERTVRMIAPMGNTSPQGSLKTVTRPSAIMLPQVGMLGSTDTPTNERIASTTTAMPISTLIRVMMIGRTPGSSSLVITCRCVAPAMRAAAM